MPRNAGAENVRAAGEKPWPRPHGGGPRFSDAVFLTVAQFSRSLARFFFVLVVARRLGPASFGVYTLILALTEIIAVVSGNGFGDYLTREVARDERAGWGAGAQLTGLRIAYGIPLTAAGLAVLWLLGYLRIVLLATAAMSLTLAPRAILDSVQGLLRGAGRNRGYLAVDLSSGLVLFAGAGLLLAQGGRLRVVLLTEALASCAAGAAALVLAARHRPRETLWRGWSALIRGSAVFNMYPLVINLYDRVDILLLSKLAGDYATGVYGAAYRPLNVLQLLPYGVLYSLLPALAREERPAEERDRLGKAMGLLLCAALLIVLATTAFADALVPLLFGSRYRAAAGALKILVWAVILRYLNYALNTRLLVAGRERLLLATALVCLAVNVAGNVLLIPRFSWRAAAAVTIATELAVFAQNVYWLRRVVGKVPAPFGWARMSLVFAGLLGIALAGARAGLPALAGVACVFSFLAYLYRAGLAGEFAAVWDSAAGASLEASHT